MGKIKAIYLSAEQIRILENGAYQKKAGTGRGIAHEYSGGIFHARNIGVEYLVFRFNIVLLLQAGCATLI